MEVRSIHFKIMLIGFEPMPDSACNPAPHRFEQFDSQCDNKRRREISWQVGDDSQSIEHEYLHRSARNRCLKKGNLGSNRRVHQIAFRKTETHRRDLVGPRQEFGSSFYRVSDFLFCLSPIRKLRRALFNTPFSGL